MECFNSLDSKSSISSSNTESDIDCDSNIKGSPERTNILYKLQFIKHFRLTPETNLLNDLVGLLTLFF